MAVTQEETTRAGETVVYDLEGTLLEACSCEVLCPCWIGENPDGGGACHAVLAYHFDSGTIRGVDVTGLTLASVGVIPRNVLEPKSWRIVLFVDEQATDEQFQAIVDAYGGKLGGPLADLAGLVGEVLDIRRAPISHELKGGAGTLEIGEVVYAEMHPYTGPDGSTTTLRDSAFSTIPGSPAYVAKADSYRVNLPEHDMVWSFEGRNAIQGDYKMRHVEAA